MKTGLFGCVLLAAPLWAQMLQPQADEANAEANALFEAHRYEEALRTYLDLYGQDTENGALAYNIGNTYLAMGDLQRARQFYDRALVSQQEEARNKACFNLSCLQLQENDVRDAIANLVAYLKTVPEDVQAKRNLELALRRLEQTPNATQNKDPDASESPDPQSEADGNSDDGSDTSDGSSNPRQGNGQENAGQSDAVPVPSDQSQRDEASPARSGSPEDLTDETVKQYILNALQEQEAKQQKQYQRRKMGRVNRHAKDW